MQKLRLQLAQRNCDLKIARRCHMEAQLRFYQLAHEVAERELPQIEQQLAILQQEDTQLTLQGGGNCATWKTQTRAFRP